MACNRYSSVMLEFAYPPYTTLSVTRRVWNQKSDTVVSSDTNPASASISVYSNYSSGPTCYWDNAAGCVLCVRKDEKLLVFIVNRQSDCCVLGL